MLISWALPCHRRVDDLRRVFPDVIAAAEASPPVEVVIVDYANADGDLDEFDVPGVRIVRYRGRDHYHMAHARNLSIRASGGDYVVITSTDIAPRPAFFPAVRGIIAETGATWLRPSTFQYVGVVVVARAELLAAGGYDERFEFYGGEDRDLTYRLCRRNPPEAMATYPAADLLTMIPTPNDQRLLHYRTDMTKHEMMERAAVIRSENMAAGVLVANEGQEWGAS